MAAARWTSRDRGLLWAVLAAALAMLVFTGIAVLGGDGDDQADSEGGASTGTQGGNGGGPNPSYSQPEDWVEPNRWVALAQGKKKDKEGNPVKFPRTVEGALAVMDLTTRVDLPEQGLVETHEAVYTSYLAPDDRDAEVMAEVREAASATEKEIRRTIGAGSAGSWPEGSYYRTTPIAVKVISESQTQVVAYVLNRTVYKASASADEEEALQPIPHAVKWVGGDWKVARNYAAELPEGEKDKLLADVPNAVAPGDAKFNREGWTAIREGSSR